MSSLSLGIYAHWRKSGAEACLRALLHELSLHNVNALVEEQAAKLVGQTGHSLEELYDRVDLFVALGGDGTLLRLVRDLRGKMKPVMGINFGSLGFLTCFGGPEYAVAAKALATGYYRVDERTLLELSIERRGQTILSQIGLNDVVVTRGERSRLVRLDLFIDQTHLTQYNADGLIIATSTGSTAYSLSAGGPIVMPNSGVFVVTPICPHVLTNRSVIVSNKSTIRLLPSPGEQQLCVNIDGQEPMQLHEGDIVAVRHANAKLPLLLPKDLTFADILGAKLRWSGSAI
ncbi:MAG: NAD(+)/NADH kinase [Verrucomicrobia bacterium]|nr:NAD(+)/NADH kinase [Verrucomicrobiota bacterium]